MIPIRVGIALRVSVNAAPDRNRGEYGPERNDSGIAERNERTQRGLRPQPKPTLAKPQRTPRKPEPEVLALCDLGVFARDPTLSVSMTYGSHSQKSPRESKISTSSNTKKEDGFTSLAKTRSSPRAGSLPLPSCSSLRSGCAWREVILAPPEGAGPGRTGRICASYGST